MTIKIIIPEKVIDLFKQNLGIYSEHPVVVESVLTRYLNRNIGRGNLFADVPQFLDGLKESGEFDELLECAALFKPLPIAIKK